MRICVLASAAGAVLAFSAPAFAQQDATSPMAPLALGSQNLGRATYQQEDQIVSKDYVKKMTALSYKTVELRAEDGGKLTPAHVADLQQELDHLNHRYGVRTKILINPG